MNIAALKEAADLADPKHWAAEYDAPSGMWHVAAGPFPYGETICDNVKGGNARFIALANPTDILALIAKVDELQAALLPFAKLGDEASWLCRADAKQAWGFDNVNLTWGDFRKARAALSNPTETVK
jgi:hypothetical protein